MDLGLHDEEGHGNFYTPRSINQRLFANVLSKVVRTFLDVLPSSSNLLGVELENCGRMAREFYLADCLSKEWKMNMNS